ncbi:hypothetical protein LUZ60_014929 [Juncus effusus]|nr:hypothetical protein LUZ60_014929 [Juncus effusus]
MEGIDAIFTKLEEASRTGDVDSLNKLLEEDKFLLERVITRTSARDNPLHVAALLGHAGFAAEIISRKPELAKELNGQGLSPLHLAAAHGHLLVVKEFLKAALDLCLVKEEKEGLMPLHVAIIKGRTLIVKELIEACEEAMHERTDGGETVLHLAVKSNSLEILEFLISQVDDLNAKDDKGNTVLHLAVARRQLCVIKLLLSNLGIDVNAVNSKAFTPLDVLLESPHEYGDVVLGEMIRAASGGIAAEVVPLQPDSISSDTSSSTRTIRRSNKPLCRQLGFRKDIEVANLEPKEGKQEKKYNADILMVVAILNATITFQAALNPPGGFMPADSSHTNDKGFVVLADDLALFLFFDIIGLFSSISVILLLLCVVPRKRKIVIKFLVWILWLATFSTALAFTLAIRVTYRISNPTTDPDYYDYEYNTVSVHYLLIAWFIILRLGILWVAIRLVIFLLKKGMFLEPIQGFFSLLMRGGIFRWQRLNGTAETTHDMKKSSLLRKTIFIVLIVCVVASIMAIFWGIYRILHV